MFCAATGPEPTLTAAEAARPLGRYVHVRATVARVYTTRAGYTFMHLEGARPNCSLELVILPDLLPNMVRHLK